MTHFNAGLFHLELVNPSWSNSYLDFLFLHLMARCHSFFSTAVVRKFLSSKCFGNKMHLLHSSSKDSDCWSSSRGPESSKMFTKTSVRPLLYGTWGMSQYWILDIHLLKPLWKMKTNDAFYSVSRRWQFGAREMGTLKYFLSSCKVADTAVQAFELFLYVPVQIWKRCWRTVQRLGKPVLVVYGCATLCCKIVWTQKLSKMDYDQDWIEDQDWKLLWSFSRWHLSTGTLSWSRRWKLDCLEVLLYK